MDDWTRNSRESFLPRVITKIWGSKSPEREKTKKRERHTIPTPFPLEFPHTHEEATTTPLPIFLACARHLDKGEPGELIRIKTDEKGRKGDQKVVIICDCTNPTKRDSTRTALAQEIED